MLNARLSSVWLPELLHFYPLVVELPTLALLFL